MERFLRSGRSNRMATLAIAMGLLSYPTGTSIGADLPDFVLVDIFLAPQPPQASQDTIYLGTTIRNDGADFRAEISVVCDFDCRGYSRRYIGGLKLPNGLAQRREVTLGDRTPLDIDGCFFVSQRNFTCSVDKSNRIAESDETNNSMSKTLFTGR